MAGILSVQPEVGTFCAISLRHSALSHAFPLPFVPSLERHPHVCQRYTCYLVAADLSLQNLAKVWVLLVWTLHNFHLTHGTDSAA